MTSPTRSRFQTRSRVARLLTLAALVFLVGTPATTYGHEPELTAGQRFDMTANAASEAEQIDYGVLDRVRACVDEELAEQNHGGVDDRTITVSVVASAGGVMHLEFESSPGFDPALMDVAMMSLSRGTLTESNGVACRRTRDRAETTVECLLSIDEDASLTDIMFGVAPTLEAK